MKTNNIFSEEERAGIRAAGLKGILAGYHTAKHLCRSVPAYSRSETSLNSMYSQETLQNTPQGLRMSD